MQLQKAGNYNNPKYPRKEAVVKNPELFISHAPVSWKNKAMVAGLLLLCATGGTLVKDWVMEHAADKEFAAVSQIGIKPLTAPLFVHGEGYGAAGCVAVRPPVFLSESDARSIIFNEFSKEGIVFDKFDSKISEIKITPEQDTFDFATIQLKIYKAPFILDAYSSKLNLGFEYIGGTEYYALGGKSTHSTASVYDVKDLSYEIQKKLSKYGKINALVFYDPISVIDFRNSSIPWEKKPRIFHRQNLKPRSKTGLPVRNKTPWIIRRHNLKPRSETVSPG